MNFEIFSLSIYYIDSHLENGPHFVFFNCKFCLSDVESKKVKKLGHSQFKIWTLCRSRNKHFGPYDRNKSKIDEVYHKTQSS